MVIGVFHRVYHMRNSERGTIIVDLKCPNCGGILITEGDYEDFDTIIYFAPIPQCSHCFKVFTGGLLPAKKTARRWLALFVSCEWEFERKDIIQCFYDTVFMDVPKGGGSSSGKKSKPPMRFDKHCSYWDP